MLSGYPGRVGIHGPFWQLHLAPRDPAVRALVQRRLHQGLDFAQEVGGSHMVMHSPFDFFGHPLAVPGPKLGAELERAAETLAPIIQRAEAQGVTLSDCPLCRSAQPLRWEGVRE